MDQYVVAIIYTFEIFEKVELSAISFLDMFPDPTTWTWFYMWVLFFFFFLLILKYLDILNMYNIYSVIRTVMHSFKSGICAYMQVNYLYEFF